MKNIEFDRNNRVIFFLRGASSRSFLCLLICFALILLLIYSNVFSEEVTRKTVVNDDYSITEIFYRENQEIARQEKNGPGGDIIKENGQIPDGAVKEYDDSGELAEVIYKNNRPDGVARGYYKSGSIASELNYKEGKVIGVQKYYYENGKLKSELNQDNRNSSGVPEEHYKYYYGNGTLKEEIYWENDKLKVLRQYSDTGKLKLEKIYYNKRPYKEKQYDETGRMITERTCGQSLDEAYWAKKFLQILSAVIEMYAREHGGLYPTAISDLTKYFPGEYNTCGKTLYGYAYNCTFSSAGYTLTATLITTEAFRSTIFTVIPREQLFEERSGEKVRITLPKDECSFFYSVSD